jgi:hypothetical protein
MFWAGVILTKAVFYFDQKKKTKQFYIVISASLLQVLDAVHSAHLAAVEYGASELKKIETVEETNLEEYLEKESSKIAIFMELYTLLFIKAVPQAGRKYINYRTWPEASALIEQLRGFMKDEKDRR